MKTSQYYELMKLFRTEENRCRELFNHYQKQLENEDGIFTREVEYFKHPQVTRYLESLQFFSKYQLFKDSTSRLTKFAQEVENIQKDLIEIELQKNQELNEKADKQITDLFSQVNISAIYKARILQNFDELALVLTKATDRIKNDNSNQFTNDDQIKQYNDKVN